MKHSVSLYVYVVSNVSKSVKYRKFKQTWFSWEIPREKSDKRFHFINWYTPTNQGNWQDISARVNQWFVLSLSPFFLSVTLTLLYACNEWPSSTNHGGLCPSVIYSLNRYSLSNAKVNNIVSWDFCGLCVLVSKVHFQVKDKK